MDIQQCEEKLRTLLNPRRMRHSLGVRDMSVRLARRYGADEKKAALAGLLHDCARAIPNNHLLHWANSFGIVVSDIEKAEPLLLHAPVGAEIARRDYGITDPDICSAIRHHTTGGVAMTKLDKIVFLADFIEPSRDYPHVDVLRRIAAKDLDEAVLAAYDQTLRYLVHEGQMIHAAAVEGRNELLLQLHSSTVM